MSKIVTLVCMLSITASLSCAQLGVRKTPAVRHLTQALAGGGRDFFALPAGSFKMLPETVREKLDRLGTYGRFELLRTRPKP
jgi:hypothetical protein